MYSGTTRPLTVAALAAALSLGVIGCTKEQASGFNPMAGMMETPSVSTIIVHPGTVKLDETLQGRLESSRKAEVRARVPGILLKRLYDEGGFVKKGDPLFVIDDAPFKAILNKATANYENARSNLRRMEPLAKSGAISAQAIDQARMAHSIAKADMESARINYEYAHVSAPISGRISRALIPEGALVGQGAYTLLATISQDDPLYVNVTRSSAEYLRMKRELVSGAIGKAQDGGEVEIFLEDGTKYGHEGKLLFTDPTIDEATSNVTLKVKIPNPPVIGKEPLLMPGMYVSVKLSQNEIKDAYLVPKEAVSRHSERDLVYKVKDGGEFERIPVTIVQEKGGDWVISGGLSDGDRILVSGFAKLMPGMTKVNYTDIDPADLSKVRFKAAPAQDEKKPQTAAEGTGSKDGTKAGDEAEAGTEAGNRASDDAAVAPRDANVANGAPTTAEAESKTDDARDHADKTEAGTKAE